LTNLLNPSLSTPEDFDRKKLNKFLSLAGISESTSIKNILVNLGVAEKQEKTLYFNNSGVLFFAKEPQKFIPRSVFTVALFKDKVGVDIIDRKEIKGSLFAIVQQVMDFVKLYRKVAYRFTGEPQRREIYEYPLEAIREAVINSVMHKDYFEHGHNNIFRFFPDRIRIENFWVKPRHFILGETVYRRNPLIVDLFSRIHFGEKMGTGIHRMKEICRKENAPYPEIEYNENYFYITFAQSRDYLKIAGQTDRVTEKVTIKDTIKDTIKLLSKNEKIIIESIIRNPKITAEELSKMRNINLRNAKRNLAKLKEKGIIERIGSRKAGHWEVVKEYRR